MPAIAPTRPSGAAAIDKPSRGSHAYRIGLAPPGEGLAGTVLIHDPLRGTRGPEDDWQDYMVPWHRNDRWWEWDSGIVMVKPQFRPHATACEGTRLKLAVRACEFILKRHTCPFKIGMARSLGTRWELSKHSTSWRPSHLFIIGEVQGREAAGYLEAALIALLYDLDLPIEYNINLKRCDIGGTGPRTAEFMYDKYFVYLAVEVQLVG